MTLRLGAGVIAVLASAPSLATNESYDPLRSAGAPQGAISAVIPKIPAQCYTQTSNSANPCWTCHTGPNGRNGMDDWKLQTGDGFSPESRINHWKNLFRAEAEGPPISDAQVRSYIAQDNYTPLRLALRRRPDYRGWRPDLDLEQGFDAEGFAADGSWWRAIRYKPFMGAFWPTNGSTDDVFVRLPAAFRNDAAGHYSRAIYKVNLAILEAAMAVPDTVPDAALLRTVEPIDEGAAGFDLDGDGRVGGTIASIHGLPRHYAGGAAGIEVRRYSYPRNTEFLHTVRYVDSAAPDLMSRRIREVRYSRKTVELTAADLDKRYTAERNETPENEPKTFPGSPEIGYQNEFGWRLQGFIEDAEGRLRTQTPQEHYYCMGCHESIGVTVDQTFAFARKLPGSAGWSHQSLQGQHDLPQAGQPLPEYLTYMIRTGGADELRSNAEMNQRFFAGGKLDRAEVSRAAAAGDRDLAWLLAPSPTRALALDRSYMRLVRRQDYALGRDVVLQASPHVYHTVPEKKGPNSIDEDHAYRDGRLWLDWNAR